jgi:hypothetical protein
MFSRYIRGDVMDLFKQAKSDIITAYDLDVWCVSYRPSTRRGLMKMANKTARKRLKDKLRKDYP